jgi:hemerythrin
MEWSETLLTGVESIDAEHMELVKRANEFCVALKSLIPKSELLNALHSLATFYKAHIKSEEEFLARCRYPRIRKHMKLHESLLDNIKNISGFIESNAVNPFTADFIAQATSAWLLDHIRLHDRDIGAYIRSRGEDVYSRGEASCAL